MKTEEMKTNDAPTKPGFYWFTGMPYADGEWRIVRVFRPSWVDPNRKDLHWCYLDGSGDYPLTGGDWSAEILPPATPPKVEVTEERLRKAWDILGCADATNDFDLLKKELGL